MLLKPYQTCASEGLLHKFYLFFFHEIIYTGANNLLRGVTQDSDEGSESWWWVGEGSCHPQLRSSVGGGIAQSGDCYFLPGRISTTARGVFLSPPLTARGVFPLPSYPF